MTRWYPIPPVGDPFLHTAPLVTTKVLDVDSPVEVLWAALAADDAVVSWGPGATRVRWRGERPFGVGTVREVTVAGVVTVHERFYRWDENERMTFFVDKANRPGIAGFAEDYVVEATPTGSRLTWTVAVKPAGLPRPMAPALQPALSLAVGSMVSGLRKKLEAH